MKQSVHLSESELKGLIVECINEAILAKRRTIDKERENINFINEGRFGSVYDNHDFDGYQINGKSGLLCANSGSPVKVKNIRFVGDRILCLGDNGEKYELFISPSFGHPLNGSNIPFAYSNPDGIEIKNLSDINGDSYILNVVHDTINEIKRTNNMAKQQICLNEASLKQMIRQIIKETELYYDTDNFSGRWNKNIPDDYIDPEGSLDDPNQNPKSIEGWGEVYNSGDNKQDEIDYSWDQFNDKGIAPSVYGKIATTSKNNIDKDKDVAMDIRNDKKNWTDRQIKSADKMKNKWLNGQRSLDDIDDAFYGSSIDEAINKAFKKIIG